MSFETWIALVALFFVGGLTPGPAVMLVMGSSFRYGFWPSMMAALGVASANVIWLLIAASGAAALASAFPQAFFALKIAGLFVIFWLGVSIMRAPVDHMLKSEAKVPPRAKLYLKGLTLQLTNPLALVTFAGILPTFFDPQRAIAPQFFMMISTLTYLELQGLAVYAAFGRLIRDVLRDERAARLFNIIIGLIMIIAGTAAIIFTA
ncbi:LysE family translocator [Robiginitomaculum antarcticum]|uniref:LysE family translocator n=1 Tax=Robiginitomaculum antarcticum TaxID=437507 RepID=UPI000369A908|nr:LysE family translocator [Robiginitomaculum antarcticum]